MPKLQQGIGLGDVDKWWVAHRKEALLQLGDFAADVLEGGERSVPCLLCVLGVWGVDVWTWLLLP